MVMLWAVSAGLVLAVVVVCIWFKGSGVLRREVARAGRTLTGQGIRWRSDALSSCHRGLIVGLHPESLEEYCASCGGRISPPIRGREDAADDFWTRHASVVRRDGDVRRDEEIASEARAAISVLQDEIAERDRSRTAPQHV